jgi:hypothetical protein
VRSQKDSARRSGGVQDCVQVLHPCFEGSELPAVIRQTRPTLVEQNQPKRPGELLVELAPVRRIPAVDEVRDEIRDIGEVDLAIAD